MLKDKVEELEAENKELKDEVAGLRHGLLQLKS